MSVDFLHRLTHNVFFLALIAAITGGSVGIAAKIGLTALHPFTLVSLRFFFALLFVWLLLPRSYKPNVQDLKQVWSVCAIGALNPLLFYLAMQVTLASVSPLIYAAVPVVTAVAAWVSGQHRLRSRQWFGVILGFIGVIVVVAGPLVQKNTVGMSLWGNLLICLAAIMFMIYGIQSKTHHTTLGHSPMILTFYFCLVSFLLSLPLAGFELWHYGWPARVLWWHGASAVYAGVIGTGVFYWSYQQAIRLRSAFAASIFLYIQPLVGLLLAHFLLGERISSLTILGGAASLLGAGLVTRR